MGKTVIQNGMIITVDRDDRVLDKGYLVIEGNKITEIGAGDYQGEADCVVDAAGKAVLPGIVDAHSHVAGSLFKALTEDPENGFYGLSLPMEGQLTPETTYHLSLLGAVEQMKAGITCTNDIYHYMDRVTQAFYDIGMRAVVSQNIVDVDIAALRYDDYTRYPKMGQDFVEQNIRLIEDWNGKDDGRITCRFGPHATDTVSLELAKQIVELGEKYGVGFHTHISQSPREAKYVQETYGFSCLGYLKESGLLGEHLMGAHCIYINDDDVKMLAESRTPMLHCAEMLGKRGHVPPVKRMFDEGVRLILGTDWVTQDCWTNMRAAISMDRMAGCTVHDMNAKKALRKSTIEPAEALGLDDKIGSLEAGKQADIILIDLQSPNLTPMFDDPVATLVYNANRHDVCDVMIAGRWTVRDHLLKTAEEKEILANGQKIANEIYQAHLASKNADWNH